LPVTVVSGARQTGKSTLVRYLASSGERLYVTLDDLDIRDQAARVPDELLRRADRMTLDEVQRSPDLLLGIKRAVDERREAGRFVLTGSANLLLMQQVSESLAGRAAYLTLWPLTRREQLGMGKAGIWSSLLENAPATWLDLVSNEPATPEPWPALARRGGYPTPAHELTESDDRQVWFDGYIRTYLERDLQGLSAVEHLPDFRRLMRAACLRIGNLLNQAELARDVALAPSTAQRYLNLLETSYQLLRLPAYAVNRTKRLTKAPKLYWSDTGLAMRLAGETGPRGAHLENLVLTDLLAWRDSQSSPIEILYWRTTKGAEVDFVVEAPERLLPIEVKTARKLEYRDSQHLRTFLSEYADIAPAALILYDGTETYWLADRVLAVPWWRAM
jgi:hypothetical protein